MASLDGKEGKKLPDFLPDETKTYLDAVFGPGDSSMSSASADRSTVNGYTLPEAHELELDEPDR